ncbi:CoA pyrophosphatase [Sphingomonas xinjiangensis]|uniref:8-oxo-dGTP pyrophosphatase MutT (NUDIX family) n=1 Tax=Sphingomonas xinjiangensis TaxID=643568 RepID=A0A840YB91_9SPHN|nr:CoA pyrophosphatase [Sphingomonas xinjiangensis]MBB5709555.1 8-oxo-dGTP pyrophosphatase MutT (NUDIX family) [Sphingomonas xinjiangensis]
MTLAERLRAALEEKHVSGPVLLAGDHHDFDPLSIGHAAAVLVAVTDRAEPGILLTKRAETLRRHAGQIAFPGGRIDPEDEGPVGAALREAKEEVALPSDQVEVLGVTDAYRTVTGYHVIPVLGVIPPELPLVPAEAEVADLFEVPLAFLLNPANHREGAVQIQGVERRFYEILWEDRRIWGATAAMLVNLSRRLRWSA